MPQVWGKVKIPTGKKIAVNLGCDFDAQSLWLCLNRTSPAYMSRGEFGAEVGLPRLMRLFESTKSGARSASPAIPSTPGPSCAAKSRPRDTKLGITATPMKTLSH